MKKLILLALVCAMAGACSKESEDRLRKATVKGAVMAYQSSGGTRATRAGNGFSDFNTVDETGNVKPIRFITDRGDTVDMFINKVEKVDQNFMLLGGEFRSQGNMYSMVLVDVRTEYVYALPCSVYGEGSFWWQWTLPTFMDGAGNIYWARWINSDACEIYRIDTKNPENMTMKRCLPDKQYGTEYLVNKQGLIYYRYYSSDHKFQCPGGRIYPVEELVGDNYVSVFCGFSGNYYAVTRSAIYEIKLIGENNLQADYVAEHNITNVTDFCPNKIRGTYISVDTGNRTLIEFEESSDKISEYHYDGSFPRLNYYGYDKKNATGFVTSESLFLFNESSKKIYQIALSDYSVRIIDLVQAGYEIASEIASGLISLSSSLSSPGLSFAGLRYADGKNVVGMINEDGTITANERTATDTPIVSLVRLN